MIYRLINKISNKIKILSAIIKNSSSPHKKIYYIYENADWIIKDIGLSLKGYLSTNNFFMTPTHYGIRKSIIHFGSINTLIASSSSGKPKAVNSDSKIIVTWYHVTKSHLKTIQIYNIMSIVDLWHTSCERTKKQLLCLGVPNEKIKVIPIGIDIKKYPKTTKENRMRIRKKLKIDEDAIVIGSFQKDGNGWGEGNEPKLIKGPDIFCDAVIELAKKRKIVVLLTGPARGYVKKRLTTAGIKFHHEYFKNPEQVSTFYHALDLYIMASRIEGGPRSLMESQATGIPIIATKVGMAEEVIRDGHNGFLVETEDIGNIVKKSLKILTDGDLRDTFIKNAFRTVQRYDYSIISKEFENKIYNTLKKELK